MTDREEIGHHSDNAPDRDPISTIVDQRQSKRTMNTLGWVLCCLNLVLAGALLRQPGDAAETCDTPPACQCACLEEWDACMEEHNDYDKCERPYVECFEENCEW